LIVDCNLPLPATNPLKGDSLYLAGEISGATVLEKTTAVIAGTASADVLEAAAEAM
jgi:hypothetical protein